MSAEAVLTAVVGYRAVRRAALMPVVAVVIFVFVAPVMDMVRYV